MTRKSQPSRAARCISAGVTSVILGLATLPVPMASAQDAPPPPAAPKPPTPGKEDDGRPYLTAWFFVFLLVFAVVGANAIPSKRGHQD